MAVFPNRNKCKCCQLREQKGNSKQIKVGWGEDRKGGCEEAWQELIYFEHILEFSC